MKMIMKTKSSGKVVEIIGRDENGFCICDDGRKRPESDFCEPTKEEVDAKQNVLKNTQKEPR